ncbi:MAG TPA: FlgD immunoglobulin-like domain containing protein [Candidatus Eisenbacteria bacterium]|nr:FlgD immunoglobulin-like domain containing protein [Candidatus Eisenbacteria bacterium]
MRRHRFAIAALAAVMSAALASWAAAQQDDGLVQAMIPDRRDVSLARLGTAVDPGDPDTVWIGHIWDPTFTAGGTMIAGGYGPYHVGRGPNRPMRSASPVTTGGNGTWDFDRFQDPFSSGGLGADSLQGWWPVSRAFQSGATTFPDYMRAFFGLDYGNQVNYAINQGSPKRTFGVVGLWHRDRGNITYAAADTVEDKDPIARGVQDNITNVQPVLWSPTEVGGAGSTASAWMGMRSSGDLSHRDEPSLGGTGNYFNGGVLDYQGNNGFNQTGSVSINGTDHNFPGYGSQMDQMLYRDIQLAEGDGLTISFNFSTSMSTSKNSTAGVQVGWFDKDPISNAQVGLIPTSSPSSDGNFISATVAGANAPCDSFMVYIGAPVNDSDVTFSGPLFIGVNEITTVYDPRRRWFSEVLRCVSGDQHYKELASYAGIHNPTAISVNVGALYPSVLQDIKDADGSTGDGGVVRLVFRVKTNRGFDDENGGNPAASFDSGTRGAAIVDNIVVNGWPAAHGDFEAADAINNDTAVLPVDAWKSTGKPPAVYFHAHSVMPGGGLPFNDPCGGLNDPNRQCNLYGKIVTAGDHDAADKDGGLYGSNTMDRHRWLASPTINLCSNGNGAGFYNAMGIDDEISRTTFDFSIFSSLYNAGLVNATTATGNFVRVGFQSYPARQANGNITWGEERHTSSIFFYGTRGCFETFYAMATGSIGYRQNGLIRTTNPDGVPDSIRVYINRLSRCYTFASILEATCSPNVGDNVGVYFDNISLALIDSPGAPAMSLPVWHLINDAFPANGNDALIPAGFDTTAAHIRTALNIAFTTGTTTRPSVGGDSVVIVAAGPDVRADMVFRILPGPGNYMTIGSKSSGVARRPDGVPVGTRVAATPGDGSFFGTYMANPGPFSKGTHGTAWSQHTWNSARMDTVEENLFLTGNNANVVGNVPGNWAGMLHEDDPNFATLGITKFRCVMVNPSGALNSTNIICDGTGWGAYAAGSGWDGTTTTKEYTKIIPDGLLTPGSHVQYFFRKSAASSPAAYEMAPDTNFIFQTGDTDGHRWQQFGILPDRWKDGAWSIADRNAAAQACMLYIDWCDRRGDERYWVSIADTIGATQAARYGAHNGWHARGKQDLTQDIRTVIGTADNWGVFRHGGQPGTIWDMFGVKGSENSTLTSSIGSRSASLPFGYMAGRQNLTGPTGKMLRQFYRVILALTGDLGAGNIGPYVDKGDNDIGLLQDFANTTVGTTQPRGVWFQGSNFVSGQVSGGASAHPTFPTTFFGAGLVSSDYRTYADNTNSIVELSVSAPLHTFGSRYSVLNSCGTGNDVLSLSGSFGAAISARYPDTGTGSNPKIASIYAPSSLPGTTHPMVTLVEGFRISSLGSWPLLQSHGRVIYYAEVMSNLFAGLGGCVLTGAPVSVGENPNNVLEYYLALRSENPMRDGFARITFGITQREKVELRIYDVAGRTVRTLANREFAAGEHALTWDGTNDDGQPVARGVYFYQLRTPSFVSQKKIAVLRQ